MEVEGLAGVGGPQAGDDGELLLKTRHPLFREGNAVCLVLLLEPARAEAEFDAAAGHLVDLRDLDGEHAGEAERPCGHQGAEADALGLTGESGEGDPGVGGAGQAVHGAHLHIVVGPEERVEAKVLGGLRHGEQGVVGGPLLGLGEDAKIHTSILHGRVVVNPVGPSGPAPPRSGENRGRRTAGRHAPVTRFGGDRWLGRSRTDRLSEEAAMSDESQSKGLLQQMEELMAALNADLSALDKDLQSAGASGRGAGATAGAREDVD